MTEADLRDNAERVHRSQGRGWSKSGLFSRWNDQEVNSKKLCVQLTVSADGNVSSDLATLQCSNISELLE